MTDAPEILFYHLTRRSLERAAPELLEKCLERGWRVTLRAGSRARVDALDAHLWTWRDDSFLPHGAVGGPFPERQPVYLTDGPERPNAPDVLALVDGADAADDELTAHRRVLSLFDGHDPEAVEQARALWRRAVAAGCRAVYWAESEDGRWVKRTER